MIAFRDIRLVAVDVIIVLAFIIIIGFVIKNNRIAIGMRIVIMPKLRVFIIKVQCHILTKANYRQKF